MSSATWLRQHLPVRMTWPTVARELGLSGTKVRKAKTTKLELTGDLAVSVSVEDGPVLELSLGVHLSLDLAVYLTSTLLDVEGGWSA